MSAPTPQSLGAALEASRSERGSAFAALEASSDAALGASCVAKLTAVLTKPSSEVDAAEYRRCCLVLAHLASLDPVGMWL